MMPTEKLDMTAAAVYKVRQSRTCLIVRALHPPSIFMMIFTHFVPANPERRTPTCITI